MRKSFKIYFVIFGYHKEGFVFPPPVIKMGLKDSYLDALDTKKQIEKDFPEFLFTIDKFYL